MSTTEENSDLSEVLITDQNIIVSICPKCGCVENKGAVYSFQLYDCGSRSYDVGGLRFIQSEQCKILTNRLN